MRLGVAHADGVAVKEAAQARAGLARAEHVALLIDGGEAVPHDRIAVFPLSPPEAVAGALCGNLPHVNAEPYVAVPEMPREPRESPVEELLAIRGEGLEGERGLGVC